MQFKSFCFLFLLIFVVGCARGVSTTAVEEKKNLRKVEIEGKQFSLFMPESADLSEYNELWRLTWGTCEVFLADKEQFLKSPASSVLETAKIEDKEYFGGVLQSGFIDNSLVYYGYEIGELKFWLQKTEDSLAECTGFLNELVKSFSDGSFYLNSDLKYKVGLIPDFNLELLTDGTLKFWQSFEDKTMDSSKKNINYNVGILLEVSADNGVMPLGEYLQENYEGLPLEFREFAGFSAISVDQVLPEEVAARHVYFNDEEGRLFHFTLKTRREIFPKFVEIFENFINSLEFLA